MDRMNNIKQPNSNNIRNVWYLVSPLFGSWYLHIRPG